MQDRYALRFETGERKGELVPIPAGPFTLGRRPGNTLQIADASISGQHAELTVDERGGVLVRDLGSTNGTSLGGKRIQQEARAAHGDRLTFGSVQLTLLDRELGDESPAAVRAPSEAAVGAPEAIGTVRADKVAQAGRRSRAGFLFLVAAVLAAGGGAYMYLGRGSSGGGRLRAVQNPAGNLLGASYSFEAELDWSSDERAPGAFLQSAAARVSGGTGLRAELDPDGWALSASPTVAAHEGQAFTLKVELRAAGGSGARAGIEFLRTSADATEEGPGPLRAWSAWTPETESFAPIELTAAAPPGTQGARALIEARAGSAQGGAVDADDLALFAAAGNAVPAGERGDYQLFLFGDPPQTAAVYKLGRPLVGELSVHPAAPPAGAPATVTITNVREERRTLFEYTGAAGAAVLTLRVEPATVAGGIATMGPGGYREHGAEFEREEATGILFSKGIDVAAFRFEQPVAVRGTAEGASVRLRVELGALPRFIGQLDFREERARAGDLAHEARNAERDGSLGRALEAWKELLEQYPFEKELVAEAETVRGRLLQQGLEEIQEQRAGVERAQFFRLIAIFRERRTAVEAIGAHYAGSEVEEAAKALIQEIDVALLTLEADLDRGEVERLRAILAALEGSGASGLAAEVGDVLAKLEKGN